MRGTLRRRLTTLCAISGLVTGAVLGAGGTASATSVWPTYHADAGRSGVDSSEAPLSPLGQAWSAGLDGSAVYGQPVVADGRVFVADEGDQLYSLDAHDGHVLWHVSLGAPLTNVAAQAGCGDIDPLGVTSTPVVDTSAGIVYAVAEVSTGGNAPVHHQLFGFDVYTGAQVLDSGADPPLPAGENPINIQQRGALALANGRVYVVYGGLAGDCGSYHGWVVGVPAGGSGQNVSFEAAPDGSGGAIWGPGGPAVDSAGNVYVTTGNPNGSGSVYTESAVELSPDLRVLAHYQSPATGDADLASDAPTLLAGGDLFALGKADVAYVLRQPDLQPVKQIPGVCGSDPDGGNAYDASTDTIYVPCRGGGVQEINLSSGTLGWHSSGPNGAPILVDGGLWAVSYGGSSSVLDELSPASGVVEQSVTLPAPAPTFASPSAADGLILVGTRHGVVAYDGPSGPPPPAPPPPVPAGCASPPPPGAYLLAAADGGVFTFGGAPFCGSAGGQVLAAPVVAMATGPGSGYWLADRAGGVHAFGAPDHGGMAGSPLNAPIVGIAPSADEGGYRLVAADGGVFSFGDAGFDGSLGGEHLNAPVVGTATDPATGGYWLVASDGGVFSFGAPFGGSLGGEHLNAPVVGMAADPATGGYWLVASDGGVFSFGGAPFYGSLGGEHLNAPVVAMTAAPGGGGYRLYASDGGVFDFGTASFSGSLGGTHLNAPVVGAAAP